ncbi:MAG: SagB/ThcOx family dehydrogenase [Bacteroidota bacterium]|nr:SagB/ThcOx family dehydrogenase [Patescibacteria group bacterium]
MNDLLKKLPSNNTSLSQDYHEATKLNKFLKTVPKEDWPKTWHQVFYKGYPRFEKIGLVKPKKLDKISFDKVMKRRSSCREFSSRPISKVALSTFLYYSIGLKKIGAPDVGNRFYPSAGARYPNEVYPIVLNVKGVNQGIYHYHVRSHSLEKMWTIKNLKQKTLENFNQKFIYDAGVIFLVSAVFWRTQMKYGARGYRNLMYDTGHLCQNFYLTASALNIGCCSIGGLLDDKVNKLLGLDGKEESALLAVAIGKKK